MTDPNSAPAKARSKDFLGRFREVISDPINLLIERVPMAGVVIDNFVYLHNGHRVPVIGPGSYYGLFSQILVLNRGVHEPVEEYIFQELLRTLPEAPLMIELGAYWAHYSMWLKKLRPRASCIMVEPDGNNLAAGRGNFQRHGYECEFIQAGVAKGHWELDRFVQSRGIAHIDVLHVDIQGYENQLIDGGRATLGGKTVDYVFVSTHSQPLHDLVVNELTSFGYRIEASSGFDHDTTSCDGLVFASSPNVKQIFQDFAPPGRVKIATSRPDEIISALVDPSARPR